MNFPKSIIPSELRKYTFNHYWDNKIYGKTFWVTPKSGSLIGEIATAIDSIVFESRQDNTSVSYLDRYALYSEPTIERNEGLTGYPRSPALEKIFKKVEACEIPIMGHTHWCDIWSCRRISEVDGLIHFLPNESVHVDIIPKIEDIHALNTKHGKGWLGWGPWTEWGYGFSILIELHAPDHISEEKKQRRANLRTKLFEHLGLDPLKPVQSREDYIKLAELTWRAFHAPYDYSVYAHDGAYYWAFQWPAFWGARAIIVENRVPNRNIVEFQAFTRAAGRMANIPWGLWPAHDWSEKGVITRRLYRRSTYYMCIGDTAIVADEQGYARFMHDKIPSQWPYLMTDCADGVTWYGAIWKEVMDFTDNHPERGVPYTPIGLLLSWTNGFQYCGGKAFLQFPYNESEKFCRNFLHKLIFPHDEAGGYKNILGPTPYGDLFDPLRIDVPQKPKQYNSNREPLPLEFLKNYRVLFLMDEIDSCNSVVERLKEYVRHGGIVVGQIKNFPQAIHLDFLGITGKGESSKGRIITRNQDLTKLQCPDSFDYIPLSIDKKTRALYLTKNINKSNNDQDIIVAQHRFGKGFIITLGIEKSWIPSLLDDLLKEITKILLPFEIRGEHLKDCITFQVNRKKNGWVLAFYNNNEEKSEQLEINIHRGPLRIYPWIKPQSMQTKRIKGIGNSIMITVAPGDLAVFEIKNRKHI